MISDVLLNIKHHVHHELLASQRGLEVVHPIILLLKMMYTQGERVKQNNGACDVDPQDQQAKLIEYVSSL
jgi:hypothetical protein